ncbi:hypothetical protein EAO71_36760 [Streptomyces sp. ms191]|nr:hypothetical protein EAO71_36760 [Streptomyces sp. ms191]
MVTGRLTAGEGGPAGPSVHGFGSRCPRARPKAPPAPLPSDGPYGVTSAPAGRQPGGSPGPPGPRPG